MSDKNQGLINARDAFREAADIIDEIIALEDKEQTPEVVKEYEGALGRFMVKMMQLQALEL